MGSPPGVIPNGIKHPNMMSINKTSGKDNQSNGDSMPTRRKSTNSLIADEKSCNGNSNLASLRRKSIAGANENNGEIHRRKLILDAIPASSNQKAAQNGSLF